MILDKRPPRLRSSTSFAKTPVRAEVRTVSTSRAQNIRGKWKEEMLDIVEKYVIFQLSKALATK